MARTTLALPMHSPTSLCCIWSRFEDEASSCSGMRLSLSLNMQGRVAEGRPLLERALAIQEKTLGHNHPDVVAIRDVLEGDDE